MKDLKTAYIALFAVAGFCFVSALSSLGDDAGGFEKIFALLEIGGTLLFGALGLIFFMIYKGQKRKADKVHKKTIENFSEAHGSARFATKADLQAFLNLKGGFHLGKFVERNKNKQQEFDLSFNDQGNLITIAGTRSGKGTSLIIPNLLGASDYQGSWLIIDPKGENAGVTAAYQQSIGQKVCILDPFKTLRNKVSQYPHLADLPYARFNPLDALDPASDDFVENADDVATMLVPETQEDKGKYFIDEARSLIAGLLLHMVTSMPKKDVTLFKLYELLNAGPKEFNQLIVDMQVSEAAFGIIRAKGNKIARMVGNSDEQLEGIIGTASSAVDSFKSPQLLRNTEASDFDITQLAKERMTIYFVLPIKQLEKHGKWLRLCLRIAMTSVIQNQGHRVTFLMDEFYSLGYIRFIDKAMGSLPGFNISLWPILQDLGQLSTLYPKSYETFIGNCHVRQFFGLSDEKTAEYVSKLTGDETKVQYQKHGSGETTYNPFKRALMTPDEVRNCSQIITFIKGTGDEKDTTRTALVEKTYYYESPELQERAKPNPTR